MKIPQIETQRLVMRGFEQSDLGPFSRFYADDESARFIGGRADKNQVWRRMASYIGHWYLRGFGPWALEEKQGGEFIGYTGLWFPQGWPERELAWGLLPEYRGHGYVTEAAKRARKYAYEKLGWSTAVSCINNENLPSMRVAERLNAKYERDVEILGQKSQLFRHPASTETRLLN